MKQRPAFSPDGRLVLCLFAALLVFAGGCMSITGSRPDFALPEAAVVLTFDDGPNAWEDTTARLLDALRKHQVRAMFCLLGENAERNPGLVRRIRAEGHLIINHGYSDKWAGDMGKREFRRNLERGEAAITAALGEALSPRFYRPQGGFYNKQHEKIWREAGYILVPGGARAFDAVLAGTEKQKVIARIIKKVSKKNGGIILLHDGRDSYRRMERELARNPAGPFNRSWIPETVDEIIPALRANGYRFALPFEGGIARY
jgi:peptidoglycan/xylan/chitin deacetylase (PgdA/CDA1 family)